MKVREAVDMVRKHILDLFGDEAILNVGPEFLAGTN